MKILAIHKNLAIGGGENLLINLGKISRDLNHVFDIVIFENVIEFDVETRLTIFPLVKQNLLQMPFRWILFPYLFLKIIAIARNYDIILSFERYPAFFNFMIGKILHKKTIIYVQTPLNQSLKDIYKNAFLYKINFLLHSFILKRVDLVIAVGKGVKKELANKFQIPSDHIVEFPPLIDTKAIDILVKKPLSPKEKKIFNHKRILINIGRLTPEKNQALLINAFARAKNYLGDAVLVIIGAGPEEQKLNKLILDLDLPNKVFLLGSKINPYKYLSRSSVFVLSSKFEGFPQALLESLYCGKFIIALDCPYGPRDILTPGIGKKIAMSYPYLGSYGMLCSPNQPHSVESLAHGLRLWAKNMNLKKTSFAKARNRALGFSLEKEGHKFFAIIEKHARIYP